MNLLIKIVGIIILLNPVPEILLAQDCSSHVKVLTDTEDAEIYIDGKKISNPDSIFLEAGTYVIDLIENDDSWNPGKLSDTITVTNCDPVNLTYNFYDDQILLVTEPSDVKVSMNDSIIGYTPLHLLPGYNNLKLSKTNYAEKLITPEQVKTGSPIILDYTGSGPDNKFYGSTKFYLLLGTAVALGTASAYFKLKADDKFDEYQVTGDPAILDQVDDYDLVSGITFTALQINFGAIVYFFLTE